MNTVDVRQLFKRAIQGDVDAFGMIYETHVTEIFRFIYYRVKQRELAEDLTQTVFVKIFARIDRIDTTYPKAYMFTVAKNILTDHWRKKKDEVFDSGDEHHINRFSHDADIEKKLSDTQDVERILSLLDTLPEEQQDAIRLKFIHDLETDEIAHALQTTPANVRQLQCRGLKTLRVQLTSSL
ncbi:MAG: hypothetical protein COV60_01180 [Candidatus Magasanikbacteria bacterium CG11_big_fil_rev_8_21_14_0_20_43_7]|uniref:RNA polymerase sigma factor n=1 Tax=Candidatus Magasanikbacteria bacterium CG11_big_fil_rev_8_21_14_0_20_43_7 TaxID=1974654 RepID=A0A2H0N591_9BACT|nr:MAG: hypothetical protein COV60_01180 [Candidatus Magasanikbacteria bacterium CG11_big_fil_rev_8_21_14_0_20_43_7]